MRAGESTFAGDLLLLGRLAAARLAARRRRPLATFLVVALPTGLIGAAIWSLARAAPPRFQGSSSVLTLAVLSAGSVAFLAYGVLFGARDWSFLRRLGMDARSILLERSLRLAALGTVVALVLSIPYRITGQALLPPLIVGLSAAFAAAGGAVFALAHAARATIGPAAGSLLGAGMRQWDPELASTAPLVYAPLVPFLLGTALGASVAAPVAPGAVLLVSITLGALAGYGGARTFGRAATRFLPRAREIAYSPAASTSRIRRSGRGVAVLLPRTAAAVWRRDAISLRRRFPWAARIAWPITIAAFFALARWGEVEAARSWVVFAVGLVLLAQAAAIVGIGRLDALGRRWIDRGAGVSWINLFLGRVALGAGISIWTIVPVSLAWSWWGGDASAWLWPLSAAAVAVLAAAVSVTVAGR